MILKNMVTNSRREPGCLRFDVLQDKDDKSKFVIQEVYKDEAALEDHKKTDHYNQWVIFNETNRFLTIFENKMDGLFFEEWVNIEVEWVESSIRQSHLQKDISQISI